MSAALPVVDARRWTGIVSNLGLVTGGTTLVIGEEADVLAAGLNRSGSPLAVYWGTDLAVLSAGEAPDLALATSAATGLPAGAADLVVLRHAWTDQSGLGAALREAYRVLKPGGGVLVADLAVGELLDATPQRYPYLLVASHPSLASHLRRTHCDLNRIVIEVVRAGFKHVLSYLHEDELAVFEANEDYLAWGAAGGWRGWDVLAPDERETLLTGIPTTLARVAPLGAVRALEPWNVARGFKPGR